MTEEFVFNAGVTILPPYRLEIVEYDDGTFWIEDRVTRLGPFQTKREASAVIIHAHASDP
jgi:hypothetical protein